MTGMTMRKALLPMLASLALCGAATAALIATTAHAQPEPNRPMMVAQAAPMPGADAPRGMREQHRPSEAEIAAHMKQMCQDRYARKAGELAYTEAKLSLSSSQRPLFARWSQASLDIARRRSDACTTDRRPANGAMPTVIDHMAREQDMLKRRLADLEAERPALEALYNSLSADQKREFGRGMHGHGMMDHHRFAGGPGMMGRHMMGPGMMDHGMMGSGMMHRGPGPDGPPPGAAGDGPPPPPPQ